MTRRVARAIFLIVCEILFAGGFVAYVATRSILLADLDESLVSRAMAVSGVTAADGPAAARQPGRDDRYILRDKIGRTVSSERIGVSSPHRPPMVAAGFFRMADGSRGRSVTVRAFAPAAGGGKLAPVTVTYSGSCAAFDRTMNRLALVFLGFGLGGSLTAAALAAWAARLTLRPLRDTAAKIGGIEEHNLDRRIDAGALPPELAPVAHRLNEMLARLERSYSQRKQFLADTSHELRTPLSAMATLLQVALRKPRDTESYRTTLERCNTEVTHLRRLVERLMEQVRSELDGAGAEQEEETDVGLLVEGCARLVQPLCEPRQVRLVQSLRSGVCMRTQPQRLRSIVINVLSNAVEHNRPGGCVELTCTRSGGGNADGAMNGVDVTVRDTGPGIPPDDLPHVFEPFYRRAGSSRSDPEHLGLGLFITHTHVKALGGECRIESQLGVGTTFQVHLPDRYHKIFAESSAGESDA